MNPPSPLAPLFHNPDPQAQANSVLYFAIVLSVSFLVYGVIAAIVYRAVKRGSTTRNLATGREFNTRSLQRNNPSTVAPSYRAKAVTIPSHEFDQEVASLFSAMYPVKAKVDAPGKGKINIKLYNDSGTMVGVVQASQDAEGRFLKPEVLRSLNSYKSKANLSRAFLVTTAMFGDDTLQQAKMMGITLIDVPLLDAWRKRAKAREQQGVV